jgi:4-hydroxy-tetrahydrodipicolinate synthase
MVLMSNASYFKEHSGVHALLITPFNEDKSIDYKTYEEYVEFQASKKPEHLFAVCGSSEMSELNIEERVRLASLAVKHAGDSNILATANIEPSWLAQVEEVKRIEATGVDALVFVTKGYGNDQERMFTYLSELSTFTELPIMLYEYPGVRPHKMTGETYKKLVDTGRFVAIKDTTCTMAEIMKKIDVQGNSSVLQANIPYLLEAYAAGARGVCATPTSCGVSLFVKMWREFSSGDINAAKQTFENVIMLDNAIDSGFNISAKYLLSLQGVPFKPINRGTTLLSPARMQSLKVFYEWTINHAIKL